jgi:uncharacterized membrane protein YqjE
MRPGRLISLLPIIALVPRLGLVVIASDRQTVGPETCAALLWISSTTLATLVGLAEVYIGVAVVSRRHRGLALLWIALTLALNALIVPLSVSGLEALPVWQILSSRVLRVAWGAGLGLLSTLCVCGCLWADVVRERAEQVAPSLPVPEGEPEDEKGSALEVQLNALAAQLSAVEAPLKALQALSGSAQSAAQDAAEPLPKHSPCPECGFWDQDQRKVAGHITQCRRSGCAGPRQALVIPIATAPARTKK